MISLGVALLIVASASWIRVKTSRKHRARNIVQFRRRSYDCKAGRNHMK